MPPVSDRNQSGTDLSRVSTLRAGLDEDTRDEIINLLEKLWRERGLTLILVTHDTAIARRAQRVGVMSKGLLSVQLPEPPGSAPGQ
jgi:ABC-type dipeptide/oligopeptide/nickel transport system ATPase subunit